MSDVSKCSIYQIPNIAYYQNTYQPNAQKRMDLMVEQDAIWAEFGVQLEVYNQFTQNILYTRYRKASFPDGWKYEPNKYNVLNSGYYINNQVEKIVSVFMKDSTYQVGCRIEFLKRISSV